jgi:hypothetical protein
MKILGTQNAQNRRKKRKEKSRSGLRVSSIALFVLHDRVIHRIQRH